MHFSVLFYISYLATMIFCFFISFHLVCDTLNCTGNEVCRFRDGYGCGCLEGQRPNPEIFGKFAKADVLHCK